MAQTILNAGHGYAGFDRWMKDSRTGRIFLVCGNSLRLLLLDSYFKSLQERLGITVTRFSSFHPNPSYESVKKGVQKFRESRADSMIAAGGGSAMDVAKCIRIFSGTNKAGSCLEQEPVPEHIRLLAIPTTAGSGAEATKFAVVYDQGEKKSVAHEACRPDAVYLDAGLLQTVPDYVKKSAFMDAFCHAVESFWSVNSTDESRKYSLEAVKLILENGDRYFAGMFDAGEKMLLAAHLAGKAIDIAQTTAGHAMCYQMTRIYGIAHGHAAALCVKQLWPWMIANTDKCADIRGRRYLDAVFGELASAMGCTAALAAADRFCKIFDDLKLPLPDAGKTGIWPAAASVNAERLKNNPVALSSRDISGIYRKIFQDTET